MSSGVLNFREEIPTDGEIRIYLKGRPEKSEKEYDNLNDYINKRLSEIKELQNTGNRRKARFKWR